MKTQYTIVRINRDSADTYTKLGNDRTALLDAVECANPDRNDDIEYGYVEARDAGAARLTSPPTWYPFIG